MWRFTNYDRQATDHLLTISAKERDDITAELLLKGGFHYHGLLFCV